VPAGLMSSKAEEIRIFVNDLRWNLLRPHFAEQQSTLIGSLLRVSFVETRNKRSKTFEVVKLPANWCAASSPKILPTRTR